MEIYSFCPLGYHGALVKIEVELRRGIPGIDIVGLPDSAVKESRERIRAAMRNGGFLVPKQRVLFNLSPAGIRKAGAGYDLALAIAMLVAGNQLPWDLDEPILVVGELSLDGGIRPVRGIAAALDLAKNHGIRRCVVPRVDLPDSDFDDEFWVLTIDHIRDLDSQFLRFSSLPSHPPEVDFGIIPPKIMNIDSLQRLGLGVSLAGGHHVFLVGPPGTGKTTFLHLLRDFRPRILDTHRRELQRVLSVSHQENHVSGTMGTDGLSCPVRYPSQSSSYEGLFGGGRWVQPGEVSLSHGGFLIMDEFMDFGPKILSGLRIPMEQSSVQVSRAESQTNYPCEFTLWAASNLCPCGARGREGDICLCDLRSVQRYWSILGAALFDRFDVRLLFPGDDTEDLNLPDWVHSPELMEKAIMNARNLQQQGVFTFGEPGLNGRLGGTDLANNLRNGFESSRKGFRKITAEERLGLTLAMMDDRRNIEAQDLILAKILREPPGLSRWMGELIGVYTI